MKTLMKKENSIIRILEKLGDKAFVIDCIKQTMPKWIPIDELDGYIECSEEELYERTNMEFGRELNKEENCVAHQRFTLFAGVLPFVSDEKRRHEVIDALARDVSKQTIRKYLILYLVYQDISVLAPPRAYEKILNADEKNFRYALNKYFYSQNQNSLNTAYTMMLKDKYTDNNGVLLDEYPSYWKFRYFYRKNRKMQRYYISRLGKKEYEKNHRCLLGDGVQSYAPIPGVGFFDSTICDIYLVDERGQVVGRPILTVAIDACTSAVYGYSLTWEGGVYSLKKLLVNMISDKKQWCENHGVLIDEKAWTCKSLPAVFATDRGKEYTGEIFSNVVNLGVKIDHIEPYRCELKSKVEKFFDLIQESYKKYLHNKGIIQKDFRQRGAKDYRKLACLTMKDFEKIIIEAIVYYNSQRIIKDFPYTKEMLDANVKPYANEIFEWSCNNVGSNLIEVDMDTLVKTMLPRATGTFTRQGLKVNGLRYKNMDYIEEFLKGGKTEVVYNPDDVSKVWIVKKKEYIPFDLIEARFYGMDLDVVSDLKKKKKELLRAEERINLQAQIDLQDKIQVIAQNCSHGDTNIKDIRKTRKRETVKHHTDFLRMEASNE